MAGAKQKKFLIGIDLGGTNLKAGLLDTNYRIRQKQVLKTTKFSNKEELISAIAYSACKIMQDNGLNSSNIDGIGIGVPGPVDHQRGIVHFLPNIPGWREVKLKKILEQKLRLPVFVDNDVKVIALAEQKMGSARGFRNSLCITLGTGVGGGLIFENKLYRGQDNAAGEIGHLPINEAGPRCNCGGVACLEAYIGNKVVLREARKKFGRHMTLERLSLLANKGDISAQKFWTRIALHLGTALAGVTTLLNLDVIVIGGGVSEAGKILFDGIKKNIKIRAMSVQSRRLKILKAKLGSDAGIIGGAIIAHEGHL